MQSGRKLSAVSIALLVASTSFAALATAQDSAGYGLGLPDTVQAQIDDVDRAVCTTLSVCMKTVNLHALNAGANAEAIEEYIESGRYNEAPGEVAAIEQSFVDLIPEVLNGLPIPQDVVGSLPVNLPDLPIGDPGSLVPSTIPNVEDTLCSLPEAGATLCDVVADPAGPVQEVTTIVMDQVNAIRDLLFEQLRQLFHELGLDPLWNTIEDFVPTSTDPGEIVADLGEDLAETDYWSILPEQAQVLRLKFKTVVKMPSGATCVNQFDGALWLPNVLDVHRGCAGGSGLSAPDLFIEVNPTTPIPGADENIMAGSVEIVRITENLPVSVAVTYDLTSANNVTNGGSSSPFWRHLTIDIVPPAGENFPRTIFVPFETRWGTTQDSFSVQVDPQLTGVPSALDVGVLIHTFPSGSVGATEDTYIKTHVKPVPTESHLHYSHAPIEDGTTHAVTWEANVEPEAKVSIARSKFGEGVPTLKILNLSASKVPASFDVVYQRTECHVCDRAKHDFTYTASSRAHDFLMTNDDRDGTGYRQYLTIAAPQVPTSVGVLYDGEEGQAKLTVNEVVPTAQIEFYDLTPQLALDAIHRVHLVARDVPTVQADWSVEDEEPFLKVDAFGQSVGYVEGAVSSNPTFTIRPGAHAFVRLGQDGTRDAFLATGRFNDLSLLDAKQVDDLYSVHVKNAANSAAPFEGSFESAPSGPVKDWFKIVLSNLPQDIEGSWQNRLLKLSVSKEIATLSAQGSISGYNFTAGVSSLPAVPLAFSFREVGGNPTISITHDDATQGNSPAGLGGTIGAITLVVTRDAGLVDGSPYKWFDLRASQIPTAVTATWNELDHHFRLATGDPANLSIGSLQLALATEKNSAAANTFLALPGDRALYLETPTKIVIAGRITGLAVADVNWVEDQPPSLIIKARGRQPFTGSYDVTLPSGQRDTIDLTLDRLPNNLATRFTDTTSFDNVVVDRAAKIWTSDRIGNFTVKMKLGSLDLYGTIASIPAVKLELGWSDGYYDMYVNRTGASFLADGTPQNLPYEVDTYNTVIDRIYFNLRDPNGLFGSSMKEVRVIAVKAPGGFHAKYDATNFKGAFKSFGRPVGLLEIRATTLLGSYFRTAQDAADFATAPGFYYSLHQGRERIFGRIYGLREFDVNYTDSSAFSAFVQTHTTGGARIRYHSDSTDGALKGDFNVTLSNLPSRLAVHADLSDGFKSLIVHPSQPIAGVSFDLNLPGFSKAIVQGNLMGVKAAKMQFDLASLTGVALQQLDGDLSVLIDQAVLRARTKDPEGMFTLDELPIVDMYLNASSVPPFEFKWDDLNRYGELEATRGQFGHIKFALMSKEGLFRLNSPTYQSIRYYHAPFAGTDTVWFAGSLEGVKFASFQTPDQNVPFNLTAKFSQASTKPLIGNFTKKIPEGYTFIEGQFSNAPTYITIQGSFTEALTVTTAGIVDSVTVAGRLDSEDMRGALVVTKLFPSKWTLDFTEHDFSLSRLSGTTRLADKVVLYMKSPSGQLAGDAKGLRVDLYEPVDLRLNWTRAFAEIEVNAVSNAGLKQADIAVSWDDCMFGVNPTWTSNTLYYVNGEIRCGSNVEDVRAVVLRAFALKKMWMHQQFIQEPLTGTWRRILNASADVATAIESTARPLDVIVRTDDREIVARGTSLPTSMRLDTDFTNEHKFSSNAGGANLFVRGLKTIGTIEEFIQQGRDPEDLESVYQLTTTGLPATATVKFLGNSTDGRVKYTLSSAVREIKAFGWDSARANPLKLKGFFINLTDVPSSAEAAWHFEKGNVSLGLDFSQAGARTTTKPFVELAISQDGNYPSLLSGTNYAVARVDLLDASVPYAVRAKLQTPVRKLNVSYVNPPDVIGGLIQNNNGGGGGADGASMQGLSNPLRDALAGMDGLPLVNAILESLEQLTPMQTASSAPPSPDARSFVVTLSNIPDRIRVDVNLRKVAGEGTSVESDKGSWEGPWKARAVDYAASAQVNEIHAWIPDAVAGSNPWVPALRNVYISISNVPKRFYAEIPIEGHGPGPEGAEWYLYFKTSSDENAGVTYWKRPDREGRIVAPHLSGPLPTMPLRINAFGMPFENLGGFELSGALKMLHIQVSMDQHYPYVYLDTGNSDFTIGAATDDPIKVAWKIFGLDFRLAATGTLNTDMYYLPLDDGRPHFDPIHYDFPWEVHEGARNKICLRLTVQTTVTVTNPTPWGASVLYTETIEKTFTIEKGGGCS